MTDSSGLVRVSRLTGKIRKKIRKKLNNRQGFTLAETLVTLIIVGLVTTAVASGAGILRSVYKDVTLKANAQTVMSTAITAMRNHMEFASPVDPDDKENAIFKDEDSGTAMSFVNASKNSTSGNQSGNGSAQTVYIQYYSISDSSSQNGGTSKKQVTVSKAGSPQKLVQDAAFGKTLGSDLSLTIENSDKTGPYDVSSSGGVLTFSFHISVTDTGSSTVLAEQDVTIRSMESIQEDSKASNDKSKDC